MGEPCGRHTAGVVKSLMEEKQEGPEGKQTPGVTEATISPPTIGRVVPLLER